MEPSATSAPPGKSRYTTISIPQPLYEDVKRHIAGSGFRSPTEYLVYVTRIALQSTLARSGVPR
jgi:hypothetical protein